MILVDNRVGSRELAPLIKRYIPCELARLEYGDAMLEGNGPDGTVTIGIERKTIGDMLACIEDSRYAAHQLPGMKMLYSASFLMIEGMWCAGEANGYDGLLIQGFNGGSSWGPFRPRGGRTVKYSKLYRYLVSVSLSGVIITYPSNPFQTAYQICELHEYFSKPWNKHTSLLQPQQLAVPNLAGKPSLTKRWAYAIDDIGLVYGEEAERAFRTPRKLAEAGEQDWMGLNGPGNKRIGAGLARKIVKEINGW